MKKAAAAITAMLLLAGCNVEAEIEVYGEDLSNRSNVSSLTTLITISSFGDRSMCDLIDRQGGPILRRIFERVELRECSADSSRHMASAIYEAQLPVVFSAKPSGKLAVRVDTEYSNNDLSWIYIDAPQGGLDSMTSPGAFDFGAQDVKQEKVISFRYINAGDKPCTLNALAAYVNGKPMTWPIDQQPRTTITKRKNISIRLADVAVDSVARNETTGVFISRCPA